MNDNRVTPERIQMMKDQIITLLEDQEKVKITVTKEEPVRVQKCGQVRSG